MSLRREKPVVNEGMSKREQRKLQQTLRLFNAFESKPKKKRKISQKSISINPHDNKKENPVDCLIPKPDQLQNIGETKQQSPINTTSANQAPKQKIKNIPIPIKEPSISYLNKNYFTSEQNWSQFWSAYQYRQMQIQFQKRNKTYEYLDSIGQPISIKRSPSLQLINRIKQNHHKYLQNPDKRPFSSSHKSFSSFLSSIQK